MAVTSASNESESAVSAPPPSFFFLINSRVNIRSSPFHRPISPAVIRVLQLSSYSDSLPSNPTISIPCPISLLHPYLLLSSRYVGCSAPLSNFLDWFFGFRALKNVGVLRLVSWVGRGRGSDWISCRLWIFWVAASS